MYQKILVSLDGSKCDKQVLAHAQKIASCECTEIVLFRVVESACECAEVSTHLPRDSQPPPHAERISAREQAEDYLKCLQVNLTAQEFAVSTGLAEGDTPGSILRFARDQTADLILMGTHRLDETQGTSLGCAADQVISRATVPVMFVRTGHPTPLGATRTNFDRN